MPVRSTGAFGRRAALCVGCFDGGVTSHDEVPRVVSASREIAAGPEEIFELIADPTQQPRWDGNDNLAEAPAEPGRPPPGHLWRWELEPIDAARTRVTHTYDWTRLTDEKRFPRARATTADSLRASLDRLAALVEADQPST